MTITCALIQMVEKIAEKTDKARMITKARVTELIMSGGACTGRIYEKGGAIFKEFGPVIFNSGGVRCASNCPCKAEGQNFCTPDRTQYRIRSPRLAAFFQMVLTLSLLLHLVSSFISDLLFFFFSGLFFHL